MQGKTPISYLQEVCSKKGITPQYDLIANEGAIHEPTFLFRVSAGDYVGTGKGASKKKAKHNAALYLLSVMLDTPVEGHQESISNSISYTEDGEEGNPIGELQEFSQKRMIPPPAYEFSSNNEPIQTRQFICQVRLAQYSEEATGKSKKAAKRNAALSMLKVLKRGADVPAAPEIVENFDYVPLPNNLLPCPYERTEIDLEELHAKAKLIISKYADQKSANLKTVSASLRKYTSTGATVIDACTVLTKVAKRMKFDTNYSPVVPSATHSGQVQCLVHLSTDPPVVCFGRGSGEKYAKQAAASHALDFLKLTAPM